MDPAVLTPKDLIHLIGSRAYYVARDGDFRARHAELSPPGYYLGYGCRYFDRFTALRERLSALGQAWVERTARLLQQMIEDRRARDPAAFDALERDEEGFRRFAFATHPHAYVEAGLGTLPPEDVLLVV